MKDKKKKTTKTPEGTLVTKEFVFKLSDSESNEKGKSSAAIGAEILEMKSKLKDIVDTHKGRIEARQTQRDELDAVLRSQEEKRTVQATMVKDFEGKEITYWFEGKIVERRTMTESELQMEIGFKGAKKQKLQQPQQTPKHDPVAEAHKANGRDPEIAEVHAMETRRSTKSSAVDGPLGA